MILDSVKTQEGFPLDSTQTHYYVSARTPYECQPRVCFRTDGSGCVAWDGGNAVPDPTTGRVPGLFRTQAAAWQEIAQQHLDEAKKAMETAAAFHAVGG